MSSQASFTSRHQTPAIGIACHSLRLDGGMGRYSLGLVKGLNELNIEPVVFTKKIDENATANLRFKLELIILDFQYISCFSFTLNSEHSLPVSDCSIENVFIKLYC